MSDPEPLWGNQLPTSDIPPIEPDVLLENKQLEDSLRCSRCHKPIDPDYYTQIAVRSSRWPGHDGFNLCPDCEDTVVLAMLVVLGVLEI